MGLSDRIKTLMESREVKEETGMTVSKISFNRTKFFEPSNTLMCNYTAYVENDIEMKPNEEIDAYGWFSPQDAKENIMPNSLAQEFLVEFLKSGQLA